VFGQNFFANLANAWKPSSFVNPIISTSSSISTFKLEIIPVSYSITLLPSSIWPSDWYEFQFWSQLFEILYQYICHHGLHCIC